METKRTIPTWASVALLVLCAVGVIFNLMDMLQNPDAGTYEILGNILNILALVALTYYCIFEYTKPAAKFLLAGEIFYAAIILIRVLAAPNSFCRGLDTIIFGLLSVLIIAKDLGKKKSLTLAYLILALSAVAAIAAIVDPTIPVDGGITIAMLLLPILMIVMLLAKYKDKEARGRA